MNPSHEPGTGTAIAAHHQQHQQPADTNPPDGDHAREAGNGGGIVVEIARHARFSWFESRDDPKRNGSAGEHGRELAPGEGWLRRIGGSGMPAIPVGFDYLSCWGSGARPGWVAEVELYPVDCRARELRAGAYSLKLAGTGGTTRTVVLSRPQSGDRWHGEVMRLRTSPSRSTRDSSLDRLFQTHG